jgi:hypothetical protein
MCFITLMIDFQFDLTTLCVEIDSFYQLSHFSVMKCLQSTSLLQTIYEQQSQN